MFVDHTSLRFSCVLLDWQGAMVSIRLPSWRLRHSFTASLPLIRWAGLRPNRFGESRLEPLHCGLQDPSAGGTIPGSCRVSSIPIGAGPSTVS